MGLERTFVREFANDGEKLQGLPEKAILAHEPPREAVAELGEGSAIHPKGPGRAFGNGDVLEWANDRRSRWIETAPDRRQDLHDVTPVEEHDDPS